MRFKYPLADWAPVAAVTFRRLALALTLLVTAAGLTGCLGGSDDAPAPASGGNATGDTDGSGMGHSMDDPAHANMTDSGDGLANESMGDEAHFHDYWKGRERVVLFDDTVEPDAFTTTFFTFYDVFVRQNPAVGGAFVMLPDGATVFEGTGELEVTVTYSDPRVNGLGFRYRSAAAPEWSDVTPIGDGETVTIEVTPEMTDVPHASTSKWAFLFEPASAGGTVAGPFHVTIAAVKVGDVTLFPGHPDHFDGQPSKVLLDASHTSESRAAPFQIADFMSGNVEDDRGIPPEHVVPMETQEMQVEIVIESASASIGEASNAYLQYRSADSTRWRFMSATEGSFEEGTLLYAIPVDPRMVDSPYADESQWRFDLRLTSDTTGQGFDCGGCADAEASYRITVTAFDHVELTTGEGPDEDEDDR